MPKKRLPFQRLRLITAIAIANNKSQEPVRLRVSGVKFNAPPPPPSQTQQLGQAEAPLGTAARPYSPLEVVCDMCGDGLGLTSWWEGAGEEEGDADMAEGEG